MKLFTIDNNGKFIQFKENNFQDENKEIDLEILLENNPEYFFENEKILIIGRQVTTNHNTFIDLLGIDIQGNTVTIEHKRDKTPRETIAQILEYASYIENLNYEQLNDIFQNYSGDEISLDEYHQQYFDNNDNNKVSFNKTTKLFIIAQNISSEIKQTALFLYKKGIEIYCVEFKYFVNKTNQKIISSNFVVGNEIFFNKETKSTTRLPKVNKEKFISSLNSKGLPIFQELFKFAKEENLLLRWGSKGFSLNLTIKNEFVGLCFGYPPNSVFKQSIYSGFEEIRKKVNEPNDLINFYTNELTKTNFFQSAKSNLKWIIDKEYSTEIINQFTNILRQVITKIKTNGLKTN